MNVATWKDGWRRLACLNSIADVPRPDGLLVVAELPGDPGRSCGGTTEGSHARHRIGIRGIAANIA